MVPDQVFLRADRRPELRPTQHAPGEIAHHIRDDHHAQQPQHRRPCPARRAARTAHALPPEWPPKSPPSPIADAAASPDSTTGTSGNTSHAEIEGQPSSAIRQSAASAAMASAIWGTLGAVIRASSQIITAVSSRDQDQEPPAAQPDLDRANRQHHRRRKHPWLQIAPSLGAGLMPKPRRQSAVRGCQSAPRSRQARRG